MGAEYLRAGHTLCVRPAGQVVEAGRWLGRFHAVAASFPDDDVVLAFDPPLRKRWAHWDANLRDLRRLFAGAAVDEELAFLQARWQHVEQEWPTQMLDALPQGWLHGDYHGRNMVFVQDRLRGLFDFDVVKRDPWVFDVAYGACKFAREARASLQLRPAVAAAFVAAYAEVRELTGEERAALPLMAALGSVPRAGIYAYVQPDGVDPVARLRQDVAAMRAFERQVQ